MRFFFFLIFFLSVFVFVFFLLHTVYLVEVDCHVCILKKRQDPSHGGNLRWSLPSNERCLCQRVVVAPGDNSGHPCKASNDQFCLCASAGDLWFADDPKALTIRKNWEKEVLDVLLERSDYCNYTSSKCHIFLKVPGLHPRLFYMVVPPELDIVTVLF